jgi:peptide/nickel transport system substrate-binding protein
MKTFRLAAAAAFLILSSVIAFAQTTLRVGLAEDPDVLDPTLARTYVGRIVFASFCDKLFDIDVSSPNLPSATTPRPTGRR